MSSAPRGEPRNVRVLRGHLGPVLALAFAPAPDGKPPLLVSAAREREDQGAVRLWDVDRSQPLGHEAMPNPTTRPGLAAWYPGPEPERLRVAIAWGDGKLRLWDVGPGPAPRLTTVPDGLYNTTVAPFPSSPTLLTGSLHGRLGQAQLRSWDTDAAVAAPQPLVMLPRPGDQIEVPSTITLVPGARPAQVAIILRRAPDRRKAPNGMTEDLLRLIDVRGAFQAQLSLWTIANPMPPRPVLGVDPEGRHLAVAGHPDHAIRLYSLPDLLQGREAPQRLQGAGVVPRQVAFVKKGPDWGLWLTDTARDHAPAPGEPPARAWIFDPTRRLLTSDRAGWSLAAPDTTGWSAEVVPAGRDDRGQPVPWSVSVRQGQGPERLIRLRPRQVINTCALLPPRPPRAGPIVAIAYQEAEDLGGEPSLGLFDGRSGEQVRQLTGHAERIQCLAFSDDGRLLASTAEDQTACVWSLTDLDDTLGKRGMPAGVTVTESGGGLVVGGVDAGGPAPADGDLRAGDGIQELVVEGIRRPVASLTEFYREVARVKPGQRVTVRRIREGEGEAREVMLPVGQATDERKPLLSLFLADRGPAGDPAWIGWSPLGDFESSGRDVERLLGWHFNTGDPAAPTRFARVDEYRDRFHHEHLLEDALKQGAFPPRRPLPRPEMSVILTPQGGFDREGRLQIRRAPATLHLTLVDRPLAPDQVESVRWRLDDGPLEEMAPAADRRPNWSAGLSRVRWERGVHRVAVVLRTKEASPQEFTKTVNVYFRPPSPEIKLGGPPLPAAVDRPEFRFQAEVIPAQGRIKVHLSHQSSAGPRFQRDWESAEAVKIDEPLTLEPGTNPIDVTAVNADAPRDDAESETTGRGVRVVYNAPMIPARPPAVALDAVVVPRDGPMDVRTLKVERGRPIVVPTPEVRVEGKVEAEQELTQVEWLIEGQERPEVVPIRHEKAVAASQELVLTPGPRKVRLRAKTGRSEFAEDDVTIRYQPQVPEVEDVTLEPPDPVVYGGPGPDPPVVGLKARLVAPGDRLPYRAVLLINGKEQPDVRPVIDEAAALLTARVPLQPGDNQIEILLSNEWEARSFSKPVGVTYKRPPRIRAVERPALGAKPFLAITATADSPDDLPLTRAQVVIRGGGEGTSRKVIERDAGFRRVGTAWEITAKDVPIEQGANEVEVRAENADGPCREPGRLAEIVYTPPPPPKPEITLLRPAGDLRVDRPACRVEFRVRSASRLERVELVRRRGTTDREPIRSVDVARLAQDDRGEFVVQEGVDVPLEPRANRLEVLAVNAGGEASAPPSAPLVVSYIPPPVHVVIDRLEPMDGSEGPIVPVVHQDNRLEFERPAPTGRVWLRGRVIWPDGETKKAKAKEKVPLQVWINGALHGNAALDDSRPDHELEQEFQAGLLLDREVNRIEIKLRGLARDAGDRPDLLIGCRSPDPRQRLHLLLVGVGLSSEEALRERALTALQGELVPGERRKFRTPAFAEGLLYPPLIGDVRKTEFLGQVYMIKGAVDPILTPMDAPREVVLIYCEGAEWVSEGKLSLRLRPGREPTDEVNIGELAKHFAGSRGVQIFLLDVSSSTSPPAPLMQANLESDDEIPMGLLRLAWTSQAGARRSPPPGNLRLLASLKNAMLHASTLADVDQELAGIYDQFNDDQININPRPRYDGHLGPLSDLLIRKNP